jgi:hypothetical protein
MLLDGFKGVSVTETAGFVGWEVSVARTVVGAGLLPAGVAVGISCIPGAEHPARSKAMLT